MYNRLVSIFFTSKNSSIEDIEETIQRNSSLKIQVTEIISYISRRLIIRRKILSFFFFFFIVKNYKMNDKCVCEFYVWNIYI